MAVSIDSYFIKNMMYGFVALINIIMPVLISFHVIMIDSKFIMISAVICSVCLGIAGRSKSIEDILKKYDLTSEQMNLKLDDIQKFNEDIMEIKSLLSEKSVEMNEPISNPRENDRGIQIVTNTPRVNAYYDKNTNTISIDYATPRV